MASSISKGFSLSLSGSGNLLVYQLGACRSLIEAAFPIKEAVGSSGGSIAATILARSPNSIDDYINDFIQSRGRGLDLLKDVLRNKTHASPICPELGICTTICRTGKSKVFRFSSNDRQQDDYLLKCIEASCKIPRSFHPWDIFSKHVTYADEEGIRIGDDYYVDGGISAPAPPTIYETRLILSPVSGRSSLSDRISPDDRSFSIGQMNAQVDFGTALSWHNLRSISISMGLASKELLRDWYQRGQDDAVRFINHKREER